MASLSLACGDEYPGVRGEVEQALRAVMPTSSVSSVRRKGCRDVKSYSTHWTCLFPQHGPGPKHGRPIVLTPWQATCCGSTPAGILRGLFHSDGRRVLNWARKQPGGKRWSIRATLLQRIAGHILDISRGLSTRSVWLTDGPG